MRFLAARPSDDAYLEVFEQDVREVGSLNEPAVWDDLSLQPLDHTTPQLIAVGSIANHCRDWKYFNWFTEIKNLWLYLGLLCSH